LGRNDAFGKITPGNLSAGFIGQRSLPALSDLFVDLQQLLFERARLLPRGSLFVLQGNARALRQPTDCLGKIEALVFFHEGEDVASFVAAEAFEDLQVRVDVETRTFLSMERTEGGEVSAGAFERQIRSDDINNVTRGAD